MSATETDNTQKGFLPSLCSVRAILRVAITAQVLAMVLALASAADTYQASLVKMALTSVFVQWVAISSALTLCLLRRFVQTADVIKSSIIATGVVVFFTIAASVLTIMADSYDKVGAVFFWDTPFIFRNVFISTVVTALALRYLYVQSERDAHLLADTGAKYDALQSRMRPHFLFNSLNSIAMLVHQDVNQAEEAILDLADIFRTTLDKRNRIPLREELDVTLRYLRMEGLRLGKRRLNIVWDMDRNTLPFDMEIPPLLLQPLAENAIYHGIQPREEGGTLGISLYDAGDKLDVVITNPVPPEGNETHQTGNSIAQDNLKNRLKLAYGARANLQIKKSRHQYRVSFSIPKE